MLSDVIVKTVVFGFISPIIVAYTTIQIAKFHFEKDIKTKYLIAKDNTATNILNSLCLMLTSMWELANINLQIQQGSITNDDPKIVQRRQASLDNFNRATRESYLQLGLMGLYYGTEIVDLIAQLQSQLNDMVVNNDYRAFDDWDNFRRSRLLPILQRVHRELRNTVFEKTKSFRLILD